MFKRIRVFILLFILATVAVSTWQARAKTRSWKATLHVAVFPVNGDGSEAAARYIDSLTPQSFDGLADYVEREGREYGLEKFQPVRVTLGPEIASQPPQATPGSALDAIVWSLSARYWAWRNTPNVAIKPDIRLYALYFDPATHPQVPHSVGLEKGGIGFANLFATRQMRGSNLVVLTHEFLHTLGATDKYDLATLQPIYPDGYANPDQSPRLPQQFAEIMAGRIPMSESQAEIPVSLDATVIGTKTAAEIGWEQAAQTK